jgi:hypothetical protein
MAPHGYSCGCHAANSLVRSTCAELSRSDFSALNNYSNLLYNLVVISPGYASACQQLARNASSAAAATQLLLRGIAAATAALHENTRKAWQLLDCSLSVLHQMLSVGQAAAQRMLGSSLLQAGGGPPLPTPQLLAELVAALPRTLPASTAEAEDHGPHTVCVNAALLLADLFLQTAESAPAGSFPAAQLRPAEWKALASFSKLALLLQQAATSARQLGDGEMQLQCAEAADEVLCTLYTLFPEGTAVSGPKELATWCELAHASWLLLATAAAVPQLPEDRQDVVAGFTADFNSSLAAALDACLTPFGVDSSSDQQAAHSAAGTSGWDVVLRPLLRLSRRLCRAAHFLAQADPASPVAASLLEALMPHFIAPAFDSLLGVMNKLDSLR